MEKACRISIEDILEGKIQPDVTWKLKKGNCAVI